VKGINYTAAFGSIMIFIGAILIRSSRPTTTILKDGEAKVEKPVKFWYVMGGIFFILLGLALIIKAIMLC
jgi:hypothetical protein